MQQQYLVALKDVWEALLQILKLWCNKIIDKLVSGGSIATGLIG